MLSQWFPPGNAPVFPFAQYGHDAWLVAASYAVAAFACYTAFHLLTRVQAAAAPVTRYIWLATVGLSMGFGIWAMQFIGMLALELPIVIGFDPPATMLSAGFAMLASAAAFAVVTSGGDSRLRLGLAGAVLGLGIGAMHYVGMAALRMPGRVYGDPPVLALSVVVAVVLATAALWVLAALPRFFNRRLPLVRLVGASIMGLAIALAQYTCMSAFSFHPEAGLPETGLGPDRPLLTLAIGAASLLITGLALVAALFDQRVKRVEESLRDAVNSISEGFVIYDQEDRLVMCNEAYRRLYPRELGRLEGMRFEDMLRSGLARGHYAGARGCEEAWLADRLQLHREASGVFEAEMHDGTWLLITDRRMTNGGIAGLRIDISRLKAAQAALRDSEERLDRAQQMAGIGSWEFDVRSGRRIWSKEMFRLRGVLGDGDQPTVEGLEQFTHPDDRALFRAWIAKLRDGVPQPPVEYRILRPDGHERVVVVEGQPVVDENGVCTKVAGTMRDVTERRHTEQQLLQAQKMETVGQLTGGLAHDFNNILGAVVGHLDLVVESVAPGSEVAFYCQSALDAALGGAELVKHLLAFSRRQALRPGPADVEATIGNVLPLVKPTLGGGFRIETLVAPNLWSAIIDTAQFESAILNLIVNARDAMPQGGVVVIEAANAVIRRGLATASGELPPGEYVVVSVRDTGIGMPPEVLAHAFEPFFTTKPPGAGSGLGLSMVFGTIQQLAGAVQISSIVGVGTTVRLYLPRGPEPRHVSVGGAGQIGSLPSGNERILLVEDNAQLRALAVRSLRTLGYQVTVAENGDEALQHVEAGGRFEMLFTDMVMPGRLNGIALARAVRAADPSVRILFTSGFSSPAVLHEQISALDAELISKPYRKADLAMLVRAVLDRVTAAVG